MADVEMGHMGPSPTSNPIHGDNVLHRRALGHKRASFSTAHSVTVESSAITVDSWLLANSLPSGDEPWDPVDGVALDRSRGVVRHSVGPGAAVFFIADWKRLWSHLAADPHDTFGDNYPFYRDLVDFLCHFRTMQVAVAVAAYSAVIGALCCVIYIPLSDFVLTLCVLNPLCFCLLYWWAYVCYKGPLVQRERVAPNVLDAYGQVRAAISSFS